MKWGRLAILLAAGAGGALTQGAMGGLVGCSSPQALLGQGGQCLQTNDCQAGLVCLQLKPNGDKTCETNLATIVFTEEAGAADAPVRDGLAEAGSIREGGGPPDGRATVDATQDAGPSADTAAESTPPADAGVDSGD